ncbi:hypothetical protein IWX49DRAFT_571418 [Phyllosticta citricarpa]|uniref:Uncharacterized protein n=1 Tax=Phyllosticta citricarpa TaxID=55181 RepID=A0ABR1MQ69_9PEZI
MSSPCHGRKHQKAMYSRTFHKRDGGNTQHMSEHFHHHRSGRDEYYCHRKYAYRSCRHGEDSDTGGHHPAPNNDEPPSGEDRGNEPAPTGGEAQAEQANPGAVVRANANGGPAPEQPSREGPSEVPHARLLDTMERIESLCQRVADRLDARPESCCDGFDHDFEWPWPDFDDWFDGPGMIGSFCPCSMDLCGSSGRRSDSWSCRRGFTETRRISRR